MLYNYLKVAIRDILKHKFYTVINILGLSSGMAVCALISLWAISEFSFDKFHKDADQIHRVTIELTLGDTFRPAASSMIPIMPAAVDRLAAVVDGTTIRMDGSGTIGIDNREIDVSEYIYASDSFFDIFSFELLAGNKNEVLNRPYTVVISSELAGRLFGSENGIGKLVKVNDEINCEVTGIVEKPPVNSHFHFDAIVSLETFKQENPTIGNLWGRMGNHSYLKLSKGADVVQLENELTAIVNEQLGEALASRGGKIDMRLQPLTDIHLYSDLHSEIGDNGSIESVILFSVIGILALLMGGFNYVSLTISRTSSRSMEASVRKTMGASRLDLFIQVFSETALTYGTSVLAVALTLFLFVPKFSELTGRDIGNIDETIVMSFIASCLLFWMCLSIFPALRISSVSPARSVMAKKIGGRVGSYFRRGLVFVQFLIGTGLLIGILAINDQLDFMRNSDAGFECDNLLLFSGLEEIPQSALITLRDEFNRLPGVEEVSLTSSSPISGPFPRTDYTTTLDTGPKTEIMVTIACDNNFMSTLGLSIVKGRSFDADRSSDSTEGIIINESAAELYGWDNPIGKMLSTQQPTADGARLIEKRVIGVVNDFHFDSMHNRITPMALVREPVIALHAYDRVIARVNSEAQSQTVSEMKSIWQRIAPEQPFKFISIEELVHNAYANEDRLSNLIKIFGILAVLVAVLGLLGMTANTTEQRFKEIGIRKTFGASTGNIVKILLQEPAIVSIIASVIAAPVAHRLVGSWLDGFAYRTQFDWTLFIYAGIVSLITALATAGYHSIKAGLSKPIDAIRYE